MKKETMKKRGRSGYRNPYLAVILSGTLALTTCMALPPVGVRAASADTGLHNPTVVMNECDTVYFGSYWQEDTNGDGVADQKDDKTPIRWRILSQDGDDAYVIADQVLDAKPYNEEYTSVTWETCTLRTWLNEEFYNNAFTAEEQRAVIEQTLVNADNEKYDTEGGNDTTDKVYLASIADMGKEDYGFQSNMSFWDQARIGTATAYAKSQGAYVNGEMGSWWWLRSPGYYTGSASDVDYDGLVSTLGDYVDDVSGGVRPALHISLSSFPLSKKGSVTAGTSETAPETPATETPTTEAPNVIRHFIWRHFLHIIFRHFFCHTTSPSDCFQLFRQIKNGHVRNVPT